MITDSSLCTVSSLVFLTFPRTLVRSYGISLVWTFLHIEVRSHLWYYCCHINRSWFISSFIQLLVFSTFLRHKLFCSVTAVLVLSSQSFSIRYFVCTVVALPSQRFSVVEFVCTVLVLSSQRFSIISSFVQY